MKRADQHVEHVGAFFALGCDLLSNLLHLAALGGDFFGLAGVVALAHVARNDLLLVKLLVADLQLPLSGWLVLGFIVLAFDFGLVALRLVDLLAFIALVAVLETVGGDVVDAEVVRAVAGVLGRV